MNKPAAVHKGSPGSSSELALIRVTETAGSTPREVGAWMIVSATQLSGTIGGGRLEWDAIDAARAMLAAGGSRKSLSIALGPAIGQCCGGRVTLTIERASPDRIQSLETDRQRAAKDWPVVLIYGAGHVGRALASALSVLPLRTRLIDSRKEELSQAEAAGVEMVLTDRPVSIAEQAPQGAAHVVMTHSHALDSLIAAAVLEKNAFAYLGIIGSTTKKATFRRAFRTMGFAKEQIHRVICPIGGRTVKDKRPEIIAALTAAEILEAVLAGRQGDTGH